jgi:hypothetical protein
VGLFDKIGRWITGRAGGTKAVNKWDAAEKNKKAGVLGDAARQLAQQKLVENHKPDAIRIIDDWIPVAENKIGLVTAENI